MPKKARPEKTASFHPENRHAASAKNPATIHHGTPSRRFTIGSRQYRIRKSPIAEVSHSRLDWIQSTAVFVGVIRSIRGLLGKSCWTSTYRPISTAATVAAIARTTNSLRETDRPNNTVPDPLVTRSRVLHPSLTRSSTMARTTIPIPAFSATPTSRCWRPFNTSRPRFSTPTIAAITTIPNAISSAWLTPSMMLGLARGTWIFRMTCFVVAPNAVPTSSEDDGTPPIPKLVSRTSGGSAKITVAINAVATPMLKKITSGRR